MYKQGIVVISHEKKIVPLNIKSWTSWGKLREALPKLTHVRNIVKGPSTGSVLHVAPDFIVLEVQRRCGSSLNLEWAQMKTKGFCRSWGVREVSCALQKGGSFLNWHFKSRIKTL